MILLTPPSPQNKVECYFASPLAPRRFPGNNCASGPGGNSIQLCLGGKGEWYFLLRRGSSINHAGFRIQSDIHLRNYFRPQSGLAYFWRSRAETRHAFPTQAT